VSESRNITHDGFLAGAVRVRQPGEGYRAGMDAVLLAASIEARHGLTLAEAGCGAGVALLCAAARMPEAQLTGFERDLQLVAMVEASASDNGFGGRVRARAHDIAERPRDMENAFDQAFCNPPFFEPGAIRAPAPGKTGSFMADAPLKDWVLFLCHVVRPGGRITMIHRAAALADLLEALNSRTGEIEVMPVRPAAGAAAKRVLVRARKGLRRGDVRLYEGLTLHSVAGGALTERASAALSGGPLDWA